MGDQGEAQGHDEQVRSPSAGEIDNASHSRSSEVAAAVHARDHPEARTFPASQLLTGAGAKGLVERYLHAVSVTANKAGAAKHAGIDVATVRRWFKYAETTPEGESNEYTEFVALVDAELAGRPIRNLTRLDRQSEQGSVFATKELLDRDGISSRADRAHEARGIAAAAEAAGGSSRTWTEIVSDYDDAERERQATATRAAVDDDQGGDRADDDQRTR